jgi:hypothetical protein
VVALGTSQLPGGAPFELVLPDSTRVVVPAAFEAESLRRLLCVLEGR